MNAEEEVHDGHGHSCEREEDPREVNLRDEPTVRYEARSREPPPRPRKTSTARAPSNVKIGYGTFRGKLAKQAEDEREDDSS